MPDHETYVSITINVPESLLHKIDAAIKREYTDTGVKLPRGQFICRAVFEWIKRGSVNE